jgi:hypothetical protein
VARLEESRLALHLEPLAPSTLLNEVAREWEIRVQQERARLVLEVARRCTPGRMRTRRSSSACSAT